MGNVRNPLEQPPGLITRTLADVSPEVARWLWPGRIVLGKLNLLVGPAGVAKSWLLLDVGARVTEGSALPDGGMAPQGYVLLFTAEDGLADTVRPRFDLAGGDPRRLIAVQGMRDEDGKERNFSVETDLPLLEAEIVRTGAIFVIIDPLLAYTGRVNTWKSSDVRGLLAPLAALAESTGAAIVGIMHLNKRMGADPRDRVTAAVDFLAAARSVLLAAEDPDDPERRHLVGLKHNLSARPLPLAFHVDPDRGLVWDGSSDQTAERLLAPLTERRPVDDAKDFLRDALAEGPRPSEDVRKEAEKAGIAWRTVERAKQALGVHADRVGGLGDESYWAWELP